MTVLSRLTQRGLTPQQIFNIGPEEAHWWGVENLNVTVDAAMKAANGKCIRLLADDIAQLPVDFFRKSGDESVPIPAPEWYLYPTTTRWDTWPDHISEVVVSLLSDGNTFIHGLPNTLNPEYLYVLDPATVDVKQSGGRTEFVTPGGKPFGDANVAHIKWVRLPGKTRGLNVIEASREATGLELAAREWALRFFSNGATLTGVIEVPAGAAMTDDAKKNLRESMEQRHRGLKKSHALGILTGGAKYNPVSVKPEDAALPILWQHVLEEAAAMYHIPPHMLGSQVSGGQAYASVEQKSIDYVQHAVVPILRRLEAAYSRFLPGDDTFVKFNEKALLRGDFESQARAFSTYLDKKVIRREEVRAKLDLPPDPEAVGYLETPNNNAPQEKPDDPA